MQKFDYDDVVSPVAGVTEARLGAKAWVVGITLERERVGSYYEEFEPGNLYTIEFEDGESIDVPESHIVPWKQSVSNKT